MLDRKLSIDPAELEKIWKYYDRKTTEEEAKFSDYGKTCKS